jgi:hypothetical protein
MATSSMRVQPGPGWHVNAADLGLSAASRIVTSDDPFWSSPFVGYLGDRAYFLASSPAAPNPQWWLLGVDVRDGRRLFAPVPLNTTSTYPPHCFLNGPTAVLCLRDDGDITLAWVIDAQTGTVSFTGPTVLRTYAAKPWVSQVGIYAIAEWMDKGVNGIGPTAELTWFVPGDGSVKSKQQRDTDVVAQTFATQTTGGRGSDTQVVFSVTMAGSSRHRWTKVCAHSVHSPTPVVSPWSSPGTKTGGCHHQKESSSSTTTEGGWAK